MAFQSQSFKTDDKTGHTTGTGGGAPPAPTKKAPKPKKKTTKKPKKTKKPTKSKHK